MACLLWLRGLGLIKSLMTAWDIILMTISRRMLYFLKRQGRTQPELGDVRPISDVFFDIISDVVSDVGSALQMVGKTVTDTSNTVASAAANALTTVIGVASALVQFIATGLYSLSDTFDLNLTPDNVDQNTPFGSAYTIYSSPASGDESGADTSEIDQFTQLLTTGPVNPGIGVYCVNCGITGQVGVTGSISASLQNGVQQAQIGVGANFQAGATWPSVPSPCRTSRRWSRLSRSLSHRG